MDFSTFLPYDQHAAFAWLGKLKDAWLTLRPAGDRGTWADCNADMIHNTPGFAEHAAILVTHFNTANAAWKSGHKAAGLFHILNISAFAKALSEGPKIFVPTEEQFESMRHVEPRIPIEFYRQPHEILTVAIPTRVRQSMAAEFGLRTDDTPRAVLCRRWDDGGCHFASNFRGNDMGHFYQPDKHYKDMEDALTSRINCEPGDEGLFRCSESVVRAAINLNLMMVNYGCRDGGPLCNPEAYAKRKRKKSLEKFKHADFLTVHMVQDVVVRREEGPRRAHGDEEKSTGVELSPHWRKGFWRRQHYGTGNAMVKTVFIRPVLVRADRAVGDLAHSRVTYRGK